MQGKEVRWPAPAAPFRQHEGGQERLEAINTAAGVTCKMINDMSNAELLVASANWVAKSSQPSRPWPQATEAAAAADQGQTAAPPQAWDPAVATAPQGPPAAGSAAEPPATGGPPKAWEPLGAIAPQWLPAAGSTAEPAATSAPPPAAQCQNNGADAWANWKPSSMHEWWAPRCFGRAMPWHAGAGWWGPPCAAEHLYYGAESAPACASWWLRSDARRPTAASDLGRPAAVTLVGLQNAGGVFSFSFWSVGGLQNVLKTLTKTF